MENSKQIEQIIEELNTPDIEKAKKEIFDNIFLYGQYAIHYPSLTVGVTLEEVQEKLKDDTSNRK